jgi:hypothetical protein
MQLRVACCITLCTVAIAVTLHPAGVASSADVDLALYETPALGEPELVFRGGTSPGSCDSFDLPDAPARAWRDGTGQVHLAANWDQSSTVATSSSTPACRARTACSLTTSGSWRRGF